MLQGFHHATGCSIGRIKAAEEMGDFRQTDRRMVDDPCVEKLVDDVRCAVLKHIDIDAGVEQQLRTCPGGPSDNGQSFDGATPVDGVAMWIYAP